MSFAAATPHPLLIISMLMIYLIGKRLWPRYAVLGVLIGGTAVAAAQGLLDMRQMTLQFATPVWVTPEWSWQAVLGMGLPLFIVTMASQAVPGVSAIRVSGYQPPVSPLMSWSGVATVLLAPFGGYAFNLAAITAAICMGREAHEDPARRYTASIAAGVFYVLLGLAGGAVAVLLSAFPRELVAAIAGLALLGTIAGALATALKDEGHRDAAILTFLVCLSGVSAFGIGAAFWGVVAGGVATVVARWRRPQP